MSLQIVTQMAVMQKWFFDLHNALPRVTVLFMDGKERAKSFDVDWNDAAKTTWFEDLLPSALLFYYNNFIPAI